MIRGLGFVVCLRGGWGGVVRCGVNTVSKDACQI